MSEIQRLEIRQPDDWHLHIRDGEMMAAVLPATVAHFGRAIIMPNLVPPVVTTDDARAYLSRIEAVLPDPGFEPLMTLYLTEQTNPADVRAGWESGLIKAMKLYPAGATTNSDAGVRDIELVYPVLETMAEIGLPLLVHGEVVDSDIDIFDREAVFIDRVLSPLQRRLPELKIVFEHITTADGAAFVEAAPANVGATVTPHHLMINRNAMLVGGIQPHNYCLPVPKRETHREALVKAVTSGNESFFLGTDSAPHLNDAKETACGCAGIFNVSVAIACYAQVFDDAGALAHLEAFTSLNGPAFYGLPVNDRKINLCKSQKPLTLPSWLAVGNNYLTNFEPGCPLYWQVT